MSSRLLQGLKHRPCRVSPAVVGTWIPASRSGIPSSVTASDTRPLTRTMQLMANEPKPREWTREEVEREEAAQRERARRDAARGVSRNLEDAVSHTEFARRFADA